MLTEAESESSWHVTTLQESQKKRHLMVLKQN